MQFGGLRGGALRSGDGGDLRRGFAGGEGGAFFGRQRFLVDANVFDGALEAQASGGADAEGDFLGVNFEGFVVLIEEDFCFLRDAVDVEVSAGGFAFAVVGGGDVVPFIQWTDLTVSNAEGEIGPAKDDVKAEFAVDEVERVALAFHVVFGLGEDAAGGGFGFDPGGEGERFHVAEVGDGFVERDGRVGGLPGGKLRVVEQVRRQGFQTALALRCGVGAARIGR